MAVASPLATAPLELTRMGKWIEKLPAFHIDGREPSSRAVLARISSFWIPSTTVLYIGSSTTNIAGRVAAFAEAIPSADRERLHDPAVVLPFANLRSTAGDRKGHGLTGYLVPEDAA